MKPYIHRSFWSDPDVEQQAPEIKLAVLWLITNSQTTILGVCKASDRRFQFETGLSPEVLQRACEALPRALLKVGDSVFVRNFIRHQFGGGEALKRNNYFKALTTAFLALPEQIRVRVLEEYPEFEGLGKGLQSPLKPKDRIGKERKGEFERFWTAYPKKVGKRAAQKKFEALKPDLEQCLRAIEHQKRSEQWRKDGGQFIPHPATWLNEGRWEDAPKVEIGRRAPQQPAAPEPDPAGWAEWLAANYADNAGTPYATAPESVKAEFRRTRQ